MVDSKWFSENHAQRNKDNFLFVLDYLNKNKDILSYNNVDYSHCFVQILCLELMAKRLCEKN